MGKRVEIDIFYESNEWRKLRYRVLRKYGARCFCCGRAYREHGVVIHVDHIKPRSKFPELQLEESNLQILCEDCNLGKSNTDSIDWKTGEGKRPKKKRKKGKMTFEKSVLLKKKAQHRILAAEPKLKKHKW